MVDKPVIYLFHGDDEFSINEFVEKMESKVGDRGTAEMNTTYLDGTDFTIDSLSTTSHALPLLANRRLIVLTNPLGRLKSPKERDRFLEVLETIPNSTALILQINRPLVNDLGKRRGEKHWLQKWANTLPKRVFEKEFQVPHGNEMVKFIRRRANALGGEITIQAASQLAFYVDENPRLAVQEVNKLLTYVNFNRPVNEKDVENLTPNYSHANVFQMVDALGNKDGKLALEILHRLLGSDEPLRLFGMIVRQFRMLLLTQDLLNKSYSEAEIARKLKTFSFVIHKLTAQVRNFTRKRLFEIYHVLLDFDISIKTGRLEGNTALYLLITTLTR